MSRAVWRSCGALRLSWSSRNRFIETLIDIAEHEVLERELGKSGEVVAITSGMPVGEGGTNLVKLHMLP